MRELFSLILCRTAFLAATWQGAGFCHGVLNTDNMSILGVTIDYGPYGFMEYFDRDYVCNHSDKSGRYSYRSQPNICMWNLQKLSEAWDYMIPKEETKQIVKELYNKTFSDCYYNIMRFKLGLFLKNEGEADRNLVDEMFDLMNEFGFDITIFLRNLFLITVEENYKENGDLNNLDLDFVDIVIEYSMDYNYLIGKYKPKLNPVMLGKLMDLVNYNPNVLYSYGLDPEYVENEYKKLVKYNQLKDNKLTDKDFEINKKEKLLIWLKKYKLRIKREAEYFDLLKNSDSQDEFYNLKENFLVLNKIKGVQEYSEYVFRDIYSHLYEKFSFTNIADLKSFIKMRREEMKSLNPKFILRNHLAQKVIVEAEKDNFKEVDRMLSILTNPFDDFMELEEEKLFATSVEKAFSICVSCSS